MHIRINKARAKAGNALIVTLMTCLVLGLGLASYLVLVSSQNYSVMRSLAWNSTIPILEAGAEEALTQLHHHGITNLSANGWVAVSSEHGPAYYKKRFLGDSYYEAYITPTDPPVVFSYGYVPAPLSPGSQVGMILASLATGERTAPGYLMRRVRIQTTGGALFAKGMVAKGQINLNGNNISTDSFDSEDPAHSDNGKYPAGNSRKTKDMGDVATNSGLIDSLNAGNANIAGRVATGPGGSVAIGPDGSVGSKVWVQSGQLGIEPGYVKDDMNVRFNDVEPVSTVSSTIPGGETVDGVYYDYVLRTGTYQLSNFGGRVLVLGKAVLHVSNSVDFSGDDSLTIAPDTGSLAIYNSGASANFSGNATWNENGTALQLQYWGLPSNTSVAISGNGAFTGTIYAPSAALTLNGGGKDEYDFVGASISKTVQMNGKVQFHYDEALSRNGPRRDYVVTSWNEM
jgi:hypothetical protein